MTTRSFTNIVLAMLIGGLIGCFLGCGGFMAKQVMDAHTENTIKLMEAKAKIDKERRSERHYIEGVIESCKMRSVEVEDADPANVQRIETKKDDGSVQVEVRPGRKHVMHFTVTFTDGREKVFVSVPDYPLQTGREYKIVFNGMNEIVSAVPKEERP